MNNPLSPSPLNVAPPGRGLLGAQVPPVPTIPPVRKRGLVRAEQLLEQLFAPECKPSLRWLRSQMKAKTIPFFKIGHLTFFDVDMARDALEAKNLIRSRYFQKEAAR